MKQAILFLLAFTFFVNANAQKRVSNPMLTSVTTTLKPTNDENVVELVLDAVIENSGPDKYLAPTNYPQIHIYFNDAAGNRATNNMVLLQVSSTPFTLGVGARNAYKYKGTITLNKKAQSINGFTLPSNATVALVQLFTNTDLYNPNNYDTSLKDNYQKIQVNDFIQNLW